MEELTEIMKEIETEELKNVMKEIKPEEIEELEEV